MANPRKKLITALKIIFSVALLYFIFSKINIGDVFSTLKTLNPFYAVIAILLFIASKIIGAFRVNLYFHELKVLLTHKSNLELSLLGMFYNLFLPGGIGGDAYKGYLIKKKFNTKTKRIAAALILDRLSGMLLLFIYACILATILANLYPTVTYKISPILLIGLSIITFWFLNKKIFDYVYTVFWKSLAYSAFVQLAQLLAVICILKALAIDTDTTAYLFLFLISSIVSVLPITLGGIGSREITFFYGATWLSLNQNTSVSISMIFFLISAIVALFGIYFHFKKPKLEVLDKNI